MKVTIDGFELEVEPGTTVLQAARMLGSDVAPPAMCYYSKLKDTGGNCRACLVEISKGSEADPRPMPKMMPSCKTGVMDGMEVKVKTSDRAMDARKAVTEFLLINHPLDCPVCDQAGECDLQNLSFKHGLEKTRFKEEKRTFEPENIGDKIQLHMNRCILCYRCVHTAEQVCGSRNHGVMNRGDHAQISTYVAASIDHEMSGNMIDVCPVGALTDKTFRFKSRVWFNKPFRKSPLAKGITSSSVFRDGTVLASLTAFIRRVTICATFCVIPISSSAMDSHISRERISSVRLPLRV